MNLTDIFAWVGPLDHKVKSVRIYDFLLVRPLL